MPTFCAEDIVGERTMSAARHKDRPACGCTADVEEIQTGGHGDVVPGPRTSLLVKTGGADVAYGGAIRANTTTICVLGVVVVLVVIVIAVTVRSRRKTSASERFYTHYAEEEPTRSYTPYTGTIPYGPWGTKPWAYAYDTELPQDAYFYLPPPYRPFMDVL